MEKGDISVILNFNSKKYNETMSLYLICTYMRHTYGTKRIIKFNILNKLCKFIQKIL